MNIAVKISNDNDDIRALQSLENFTITSLQKYVHEHNLGLKIRSLGYNFHGVSLEEYFLGDYSESIRGTSLHYINAVIWMPRKDELNLFERLHNNGYRSRKILVYDGSMDITQFLKYATDVVPCLKCGEQITDMYIKANCIADTLKETLIKLGK